MKKILVVLLSSAAILSAQIAIKAPANENLAAETTAPDIIAPTPATHLKVTGSFSVDGYEDEKLTTRSLYKDGLCEKFITYNTQTQKRENEIEYLYDKSGRLKQTKYIKGESIDPELEDKFERDFNFQRDYLLTRGISFPLADLVVNEISDLAEIFLVADNYNDFQTETRANGNNKVIKFTGFNKTTRFAHSTIGLLTGNVDWVKIVDYELTLENGFPLKELYRIPDGLITREYSYKNGRLTGVVHRFTHVDGRSNQLRSRFEYRDLK